MSTPDLGIIVLIILGAGLLTGTTNFLINASAEKPETGMGNYFKNILLSICAATAVPLFLQAISSSLLDSEKFADKNYFIFASFCILAGYYAKRFLEDLYSKVNKADKKADAAQRRVAELEEEKTEVDQPTGGGGAARRVVAATPGAGFTEDETGEVIKAIRGSSYFFRTAHGIAVDTGLDEQKVLSILYSLEKEGLAGRQTNRAGKEIWRLLPHS